MVDIMTALATASQAIKLTQDLRGIDKALNEAEFKLKIADLTGALADLKMALTDAKDELVSKDAEIATLKEQFKRSAETIEIAGFKYDKTGDGKPKGKSILSGVRTEIWATDASNQNTRKRRLSKLQSSF